MSPRGIRYDNMVLYKSDQRRIYLLLKLSDHDIRVTFKPTQKQKGYCVDGEKVNNGKQNLFNFKLPLYPVSILLRTI